MENTKLPSTSNGYCAITIRCAECNSAWRFVRILGGVHGPPKYCIFCNSQKIGLSQDVDMSYDEILAASYEISINRFKKIYSVWSMIGDKNVRLDDFVKQIKKADDIRRTAKENERINERQMATQSDVIEHGINSESP